MKKNKKVTIITPLLNEQDNIEIFYREVSKIVNKIKGYTFSFLFVDDGSKDKSWKVLESLNKRHKNVSAIKFSRNFGSHLGLFAGIEEGLKSRISPDFFILTVIDMQNPPQLIPEMIKKAKGDTRVVWGYRYARQEAVGKVFSDIYYYLVKRFALSGMPDGGIDYCLIDRKVASDITGASEKNSSIFGMILWLGYKQEMIPYVRKAITGRKSRWTLQKKIKLLIDTFVSFSDTPIRLVTYTGIGTAFLGFLYAAIVLVRRIFFNIKIQGWTSLMFVVLVLFGVSMIMLGIIAEYLWRTFDASRKRPMYLIDEKINI